jgi:hypothetical protein
MRRFPTFGVIRHQDIIPGAAPYVNVQLDHEDQLEKSHVVFDGSWYVQSRNNPRKSRHSNQFHQREQP